MRVESAYWRTRAEERERRRKNARKMAVSGRSYVSIQRAAVKRAAKGG